MKNNVLAMAILCAVCSAANAGAGEYTAIKPAVQEQAPQSVVTTVVAKQAPELSEVKGSDWLSMNPAQRTLFAGTMRTAMIKGGIPVQRPASFYIEMIDWLLKQEPGLTDKFVDDIFVFGVYDNEPATRPAIDEMRKLHAQNS